MARTILAIPASSAAVEGLFSIASQILTKKRSNLAPKTLNRLICLRDWGVKGTDQSDTGEEDLLEPELEDSSSEYAEEEELDRISISDDELGA